ncbi:MAG TPA: type II secretion system F family protein [Wenzhouxiangellaceae bacterium]|nr:type II secretion system F family protein [Wenzhouxiangellaceae bacterium]
MAAFEFQAMDGGRQISGVVQADTARMARQQLRERGLVPLEVQPVARTTAAGRGGARLGRERALILRQMAALLKAGLPLEEVLSLAADQSDSKRVNRPLAAIRARVLEGQSLSDAMAEQPALFPAMYTRSIAAAEQAGKLDSVIARLAHHAERRLALARSVSVALVYPLLLALISLGVVWGLLGFVVPRVVSVFEYSDQQLPLMTRSLLEISSFVSSYGLLVVVALVVLAFASAALLRLPGPRMRVDRALLKLPLAGRLVRAQSAAMFARTLAILVSSSVPAVEALKAASEVVANRKVRADLETAAARVREGASISAAMQTIEWLPPLTRRLIHGGEQAGELGEMLEHAAELQESDLQDTGQVLMAVLQPTLILLVGLVVLYIVLAILLPIMNMSQLLS